MDKPSPSLTSQPVQPWRCLLYDLLMYPFTLTLAIGGLPCLVSVRATNRLANMWLAGFFSLNRQILGIECHFQPQRLRQDDTRRGKTPPPAPRRGVVIAAKHQSAWETLALRYYYPNAVAVAKCELFWLPFGWYMWRLGYIPLDRGGQARALKRLMCKVKQRLDEGRDVIIFPEGTRRLVGAPPQYKSGIYALYNYAGAEVLPMALNSGYVWGRRPMYRQPGEIFLAEAEPIPSGLDKKSFMQELERRIETAYKALPVRRARQR